MTKGQAEAPLAGLRLLSREEILQASDLAVETVPTPEWGEGAAVRVRALDVNRRQAYFEFISVASRDETGLTYDAKPFVSYDAAMAALAIVDEEDQPVFTLGDIEALGTKNLEPVARIAGVARRLSKMRAEDQEVLAANLKGRNGVSASD